MCFLFKRCIFEKFFNTLLQENSLPPFLITRVPNETLASQKVTTKTAIHIAKKSFLIFFF